MLGTLDPGSQEECLLAGREGADQVRLAPPAQGLSKTPPEANPGSSLIAPSPASLSPSSSFPVTTGPPALG